jgi:ribosomal protein S18 acetylase RimI-like enzyme
MPRHPGWLVRPATPADRGFVRKLAGEVFASYGDYGRLVPEWMSGAGVRTLIVTEAMEPAGFAVTCMSRVPSTRAPLGAAQAGAEGGDACLAVDLMAIAIEPARQGRGLGRWLLEVVVEGAQELAATTDLPVVEVTLTVAEDNVIARHLFATAGFVAVGGGGGTYPGGQVARQMARPIRPRP